MLVFIVRSRVSEEAESASTRRHRSSKQAICLRCDGLRQSVLLRSESSLSQESCAQIVNIAKLQYLDFRGDVGQLLWILLTI